MIKADQRLLLSFDWLWLAALLVLSAAGVAAIWSTTEGTGVSSYLGRQLICLGLSLFLFFALLYLDYHTFCDFISVLYAAGMAALMLVLFAGREIHSNKSWIDLGLFRVQPSEFMKVLVIIALARYYADLEQEYLGARELLVGGLIVFAPVSLILLQRDLGTAVTFIPIYAVLSLLAGIRRKHLVVLLLIIAILSPISWYALRSYQKGRIGTALNPASDPRGLGYQTIQSEIAVGSGRFLGKGFKRGSQAGLGFLPAHKTDFVFAVLSEEKGFLGSIAILGLFLFVSQRLFRAAREAKDKVGTMIVVGVLALLLFHVVINIGMVVGLLPIAGIPLPFISAGGSSLISCYVAMSLSMNVRMRRYVN